MVCYVWGAAVPMQNVRMCLCSFKWESMIWYIRVSEYNEETEGSKLDGTKHVQFFRPELWLFNSSYSQSWGQLRFVVSSSSLNGDLFSCKVGLIVIAGVNSSSHLFCLYCYWETYYSTCGLRRPCLFPLWYVAVALHSLSLDMIATNLSERTNAWSLRWFILYYYKV